MSFLRPTNRLFALVPPMLSAAAFTLALAAGLPGWEQHTVDEQLGAHIFQLLIAVQVPIVAVYVATTGRQAARVVCLHAALAAATFKAPRGTSDSLPG